LSHLFVLLYLCALKIVWKRLLKKSKQGESLVLENKTREHKENFIESYGCKVMNFSDSEISASILSENI
jgi:hypothetical protein